MPERKYHFHDGKSGASLAVRITPRAMQNQIVEALSDGTIRIRLTSVNTDSSMNQELLTYLSGLLEVPQSKLEIVAGESSRDKLVAIFDLDAETVHQRLIRYIV